jgi:hypothetical protein
MDSNRERFKIYTYCTDVNNTVFKQLSSQLQIELLPILKPWTWDFYPKSLSLYETLKNVDGDIIVLVCDSYDVLPITGVTNETLLNKIINEFNLDKITFNAEKNCYPNPNLKNQYPNVESVWKFLNGGIYVGRVKNVISMLEVSLPKMKGIIDQEIFSTLYVNNECNIEIDYNCKVFQTLFMLEDNDLTVSENQIKNNKTGHFPILVHGNGKSSLSKFLKYDK